MADEAAYLVQSRNAHGRTCRLAVGKVGTLTPEEARKAAKGKLAQAEKGGDPAADRHAARKAMTVSELCEWYLKEAPKTPGPRGRIVARACSIGVPRVLDASTPAPKSQMKRNTCPRSRM